VVLRISFLVTGAYGAHRTQVRIDTATADRALIPRHRATQISFVLTVSVLGLPKAHPASVGLARSLSFTFTRLPSWSFGVSRRGSLKRRVPRSPTVVNRTVLSFTVLAAPRRV
jgi:hypothetical protein